MFRNRWQKTWSNSTSAKHTRLFLPANGTLTSVSRLTALLGKSNLSLLTQVVSGHGPFRGHVGHWREKERPCCSLCLEDVETAWHLWTDCPALELERREASNREANLAFKLVDFFSNNRVKTLMRQVVDQGTESGDD